MNNEDYAFPAVRPDGCGLQRGITLRDYFAAKAMMALLANPKLSNEIVKQGKSWIMESAYAWADSMLEERAK